MEGFQKYFVHQKGHQTAFKIFCISQNKLQIPSVTKTEKIFIMLFNAFCFFFFCLSLTSQTEDK